jgi:uncharacterized paraquat-inducible protein A
MQKQFDCNECGAMFKIKYNLDESYYHVNFCPFCSHELYELDEEEDEE